MTKTRRKKWQGCGVEVPVGTIVIRRHNKSRARYVKVRMRGRQNERWRPYARWWWEQHRGPVPEGKRVLHADGDTLNDDPSNLILGTADDVLMLSRDWDPGLDDRNRINCARGAAESNRVRAMGRRIREWLPSRWYAVDHAGQIVVNDPKKKRAAIWPDEIRFAGTRNGHGADAAAVGFPGLGLAEAIVLATLLDRGEMTAVAIRAEASRWRALLWPGCEELRIETIRSVISSLKRRSLIRRLDARPRKFLATAAAAAARRPGSPYVPVRGEALTTAAYQGLFRWTPGVNDGELDRWRARLTQPEEA